MNSIITHREIYVYGYVLRKYHFGAANYRCFEYYGKITFWNDTFTVHFTILLSCTPHPGRSHPGVRPRLPLAHVSRLIKRVDVRSDRTDGLNNVEIAFIRRTLQDAMTGLIKRGAAEREIIQYTIPLSRERDFGPAAVAAPRGMFIIDTAIGGRRTDCILSASTHWYVRCTRIRDACEKMRALLGTHHLLGMRRSRRPDSITVESRA